MNNHRNIESINFDYDISKIKWDTSVNEFILIKALPLDSMLGVRADSFEVVSADFEGICISNKDEDEYLFLHLNHGRIGYQFDRFSLTDTIPSDLIPHKVHTSIPRFVSSNGAHIGMSKLEFIKIYLNSYVSPPNFDSVYKQYWPFEMLYNDYYFRNDTLIRIEMGFDW